uniref:ATP-dependent RNA helicase DBP9 n=1 Tax=Lygus hesperus TaxID=30085 RepID=A0A0A9ZDY3_LYGHE
MDGDDGGGGYNDDNDGPVRHPGYNDNCRDDNPFDPTNRNNDPFSTADDKEEIYRNERERLAEVKETDIDAIKPCDDDDDGSTDGRGGGALGVMLGGSLANSMMEGLADKPDGPVAFRNGKALYSNFKIDEGEKHDSGDSNCAQDCIYYSVLCCQCSIL